MNPECPKDGLDEILAYLDGETSAEDRAAFEARLLADEAMNREFAIFQRLYADLEAVGGAAAQERKEAYRMALRCGEANLAVRADELAGYITQDLDEVARQRVKRQLDKDLGAIREAAALGEMREVLQDAGRMVASATPRVDLLDGVLRKVAELRAAGRMGASFPAETEALFDAYLDDALDGESEAILDEMGVADPRVGEAHVGWKEIRNDLESIGEAVKRSVPKVDLVQEVLERVRPKGVLSPLRTRAKPSGLTPVFSRPLWRYAALAAAAGLIIALGVWARVWPAMPSPAGTQLARQFSERAETPVRGMAAGRSESIPKDAGAQATPIAAEPAVSGMSGSGQASIREALEAYRNALEGDIKSAQRLARWSLVDAEKARMIVQRPEAPLDAKIGACQFLSPAEASPVLTAAVQRDRKDFHARLMLAEKDAAGGGYDAAKMERLESWGATDSENALPLYLAGRALLEQDPQGNRGAAFDALDRAGERPNATAYALEHANRQEEALRGKGLDENAAAFLAAATLGNDAYSTVTGLGKDLIGQGTRIELEGDYPAAERIYQAVLQMGTQVLTSAMAAQERLAGLDVRKSACASLELLYLANGDSAKAQSVHNESAQVSGDMEELDRQLEAYNALFAEGGEQHAAEVARQAIEFGDTALFEGLR